MTAHYDIAICGGLVVDGLLHRGGQMFGLRLGLPQVWLRSFDYFQQVMASPKLKDYELIQEQ